jgi:uncharacterized protein (TIGR04255 family)
MSTTAVQDEFRPVHDAHSIEQVAVTIQFSTPLADDAIRAVSEAINRFSNVLPNRNDIRGMGFQIGPNGVTPITTPMGDQPSGIIRSLADARGVQIKELHVDRQNLIFRSQAYTRWDAFWEEAKEYSSEVLRHLNGNVVTSYGLTYIDKFLWMGRPERCVPTDLLRENSPFIASKSLHAHDLWHCHSGAFTRMSDTIKRLEVVDLDCVDESDVREGEVPTTRRAIRIAMNVVDVYNQVGYAPHAVSGVDSLGELDLRFNELHARQKRIIGEILNDQSATRIGLYRDATKQHIH